ncbi:MAG: zf-HC2 domain-containing protein [Mycobacteriaceae bacterium]
MQDDRGRRETAGPSSWAHRARSVGERVIGHAGHALGEEHLGTEALVAFVDGELSLGAHQRAAAHVAGCVECSDEVRAQVQARSAVRGAPVPRVPIELLGALRGIPGAGGDHGWVPGSATRGAVVLDENGGWVAVLRPDEFGATSSSSPPTCRWQTPTLPADGQAGTADTDRRHRPPA